VEVSEKGWRCRRAVGDEAVEAMKKGRLRRGLAAAVPWCGCDLEMRTSGCAGKL